MSVFLFVLSEPEKVFAKFRKIDERTPIRRETSDFSLKILQKLSRREAKPRIKTHS